MSHKNALLLKRTPRWRVDVLSRGGRASSSTPASTLLCLHSFENKEEIHYQPQRVGGTTIRCYILWWPYAAGAMEGRPKYWRSCSTEINQRNRHDHFNPSNPFYTPAHPLGSQGGLQPMASADRTRKEDGSPFAASLELLLPVVERFESNSREPATPRKV